MINLPDTEESTESGLTTITVTSDGDLSGFQIVYHENEPIIPYLDSSDEIPPLASDGIEGVGMAANLQPPTVFDNPVKLILPIPGEHDPNDLRLYLFNGFEWVYASSYDNTGGMVQPGGEGWIIPESLVYYNDTSPPALEVQVYHFSAIQAGIVGSGGGSDSVVAVSGGGGGGGCFISTMTE